MDTNVFIKEGDNLILKKETNLKLFKVWKNRKVFMDRKNFLLNTAIGQPYGTVWEVRDNDVVQIPHSIIQAELLESDEGKGDNRNIVDDSSTQKLSRDDISSLKESGLTGESIVEHLVENSATFKEKTIYSQAKYRKRKRDKHLTRFQILRPSTRLLCEMYWNKAPSKVIQLRADTLTQILTAANIQPNTKVMLVETTQGLLLGAVMERMAGLGTIVQFHSEDTPVRLAVDAYNFSKAHHDIVHSVLLSQIGDLLKETDGSVNPQEILQEGTDSLAPQGSGDNVIKSIGSSHTKETAEQDDVGVLDVETTLKESHESKIQGSSHDMGETDVVTSEFNQGKDTAVDTVMVKEGVNQGKDATMETSTVKEDASQRNASARDTTTVKDIVKEEGKSRGKRKMETPEEKEAKLKRQQQRLDAYNRVKQILQPKDMDALVVVCKFQPSPILMALIELLSISRPFVVYCSNKEPLMECYLKLRERGGALNLRISETWLRNYQGKLDLKDMVLKIISKTQGTREMKRACTAIGHGTHAVHVEEMSNLSEGRHGRMNSAIVGVRRHLTEVKVATAV